MNIFSICEDVDLFILTKEILNGKLLFFTVHCICGHRFNGAMCRFVLRNNALTVNKALIVNVSFSGCIKLRLSYIVCLLTNKFE